MSAVRGFIFDLDGVLVDTARFHYLAWRRLAREEFDFDLTPELNEQFKGVNRVACMKLLCEWTGAAPSPGEFNALMSRKNAWYVEYVDKMTPADVLPGALEFLDECRKAGLKLAIGSASKNCKLVLERTGLGPLFDAVSDGTVVTRAKPDPEVFLTAAKMLGLSPAECVVFEDAQAGIDAATAGGMRAVGISAPGALVGCDAEYPGLDAVRLDELLSRLCGQQRGEMELTFDDVLGKTILVGITYYTHDGVPIEQKQFWGVVSSCDSKGIRIKRTDGGTFTLPPDLSSTRVAQAGEYRLRSTGEVISDPDFLSTWNLVKPEQA